MAAHAVAGAFMIVHDSDTRCRGAIPLRLGFAAQAFAPSLVNLTSAPAPILPFAADVCWGAYTVSTPLTPYVGRRGQLCHCARWPAYAHPLDGLNHRGHMSPISSTRRKAPKPKVEDNTAQPKRDLVPHELRNFDQLPSSCFVRMPVVRALFGSPAPSTIWRGVKAGRIPAPVKLGPNLTAWNVGTLRAALAAFREGANHDA
jgi:predicted DNA-binding transcriptional regulator AlpA